MKKIMAIGWKDLTVIFRDRAALLLMLAAPFVLTLAMGLVNGSFAGDDNSGLGDIPVVVVNQDEGELGQALVDILNSAELADLLAPTTAVSPSTARQQIHADEVAAVVIIPAGFSDSLIPNQQTGQTGESAAIELYTNPARPISASVVQAVVTEFVNRVETDVMTVQVAVPQLVRSGRVAQGQIATVAEEMAAQLLTPAATTALITLDSQTAAGAEDNSFNVLAFFAPAMALFFLMYTVTLGARGILQEREMGTMARLLVSPTTAVAVLGGKVLGTFLTGLAQVTILIVATSLLFGLRWGDPLGVALLIAAVAAAATGWGLLLAAVVRTTGQAGSIGTAVMLIFGVLGGSFFPTSQFTGLLRLLGRITPHAWAMEGFQLLAQGGTLADVTAALGALLVMAGLLFALASLLLRQRWATT